MSKSISIDLYNADCLELMKGAPDNSVDAIVTDPPYGLAFMGKKWDYDVPSVEIWQECLRVLKPGGHLLSFGGTRTYHRMVVAIEDAGFEIRDQVQWIYGSGFPKSLDVSKAIDKAAGAEGEIIGKNPAFRERQLEHDTDWETAMRPQFKRGPATDAAKQWQGWGTALKPANEPIVLARKPLSESTVATNVLKWGTGGINIDASRIGTNVSRGRFPSNLLLDETAAEMLDAQSGPCKTGGTVRNNNGYTEGRTSGDYKPNQTIHIDDSSTGRGASRFFYVAKASKRERNEGLDEKANVHPTVKPLTLMRYLCRLITPPGGVVLDPFMGSGSTGVAALREGFSFIGIEREKEYFDIAEKRVSIQGEGNNNNE